MNEVKYTVDGFVVYKGSEPSKRFVWLNWLIQHYNLTIGAEIGCANGRTTEYLLRHNATLKLFAVDLWQPVPAEVGGGRQYKNWDFDRITQLFHSRTKPYANRMEVLCGVSWEMADLVRDNSLDFIFIDADHEYESVVKDIKAWTPKLKPGGFVTGHDTHFPDVLHAVEELIPEYVAVGVDHCWMAKKEDVQL